MPLADASLVASAFHWTRLGLAVAGFVGFVGVTGPAESNAQLIITTDTTQDGGTLTVDPAGVLVLHGNLVPLLTLTNGATTNNVWGLVVGSYASGSAATGGGDGQLRLEGGSTLGNIAFGSAGVFGGVETFRGSGYLGLNVGTAGSATVTGAGSAWTNWGELVVGNFGTGTLVVEAGGAVGNTFGTIGGQSGSIASATVTGAGSIWTNTEELNVGLSGTGTLTVEAGGAVGNRAGSIASSEGSSGSAAITGAGSTWTNSADLGIAFQGNGSLTVEAGATVTNVNGALARGSNGTATATVHGAGSTWTNTGALNVGLAGAGTLNIEAGGFVSSFTTATLGLDDDASGTAIVTGTGSTWAIDSALVLGGFGSFATTGIGTLTIEDGGLVDVGLVTIVHASGSSVINLRPGGMLRTGALDLTNVPAHLSWTGGTLELTGDTSDVGLLSVPADGLLTGTGTISGTVTNAGTIAPGNSPGILDITGDLTSTGNIEFDIAGLVAGSEHDVLSIAGDANLGGTLTILVDGDAPGIGDAFTLMSFAALTDIGYTFDFTGAILASGLAWDTSTFAETGVIRVVPEPGGAAALVSAALLLLMLRRRQPD